MHNLGQSPIFHTNLPYFRRDFLQRIGFSDIGAVVVALPMKPTTNPFCPIPTKLQLEQDYKLEVVRDCLLSVLQQYVTMKENFDCGNDDDETMDDELGYGSLGILKSSNVVEKAINDCDVHVTDKNKKGDGITPKMRQKPLGPLNLQGCINYRLSVADVLSKSIEHECGSWEDIANALRHVRRLQYPLPSSSLRTVDNVNLFQNHVYGNYSTFVSVPPDIHAAVSLNAMMEKYTSGFHNSFF